MKYYVYLLLDPTNLYLPFYVGKGTADRWKIHFRETKENTENRFKYRKIQVIRARGFEPIAIKWADRLVESDAYDLEESLIERFGRRVAGEGILTNIHASNRPPQGWHTGRMTDAARKRMSEARKGSGNPMFGRERSPEHNAIMHARMVGESNPMFGKTHSQEVKDRWKGMKRGQYGKKFSEEHKAKIAKANTGKTHDDEAREKIRVARTKQVISPEIYSKIAEKNRGRKRSPETIEKMKQAWVRRKQRIVNDIGRV